jgi:tetratricopeptide (TPR) repeat protein
VKSGLREAEASALNFLKQQWVKSILISTMADSPEQLIADGYHAAYTMRQPQNAKEIFVKAMTVAQRSGNMALLAQAVTGLGKIERDLHETDAARAHYEEAASLLRTLDDPLRLAHTTRHVGDILSDQGQFQSAVPHYEEALTIYRAQAATPPLDLANAVAGYARLREKLGNAREAIPLWLEAKSLYASVNAQGGVHEAESRLAMLRDSKESG